MKYQCPAGHPSAYRTCLKCAETGTTSLCEPTDGHKGSPGRPFQDETGKRYGRLVVVRRASNPGEERGVYWLCLCDCGKEKIANGPNLRRGHCKSCGCLFSETRSTPRPRARTIADLARNNPLSELEKARAKRVAAKLNAKAIANMAAQSTSDIIQAMRRRG